MVALVSLIIVVLTLIGRYAIVAIGKPKGLRSIGPSVGLAVIVAVSWPLQFIGVSMQAIASTTLILALIGIVAPLIIRPLRPLAGFILGLSRAEVWFLIVGIAATAAFLYPALRDHGLTLASLGNPDPISYSLDARQSLEHGFSSTPGVLNRDLGADASWNWAGAVIIEAFAAGITGRDAGSSLLLTVALLTTLGIWQAAVLAERMVTTASGRLGRAASTTILLAPFIGVIAWLNPFGGYIAGNGFLAQLAATALMPALALLLITAARCRDRESLLPIAVVGGLVAGAAITVFAAVAPFLIVLLLLGILGPRLIRKRPPSWGGLSGPVGAAVGTAIIAGAGGLLWFSINGVLVTSGSTAGWPMSLPSPLTLLGATELIMSDAASPFRSVDAIWVVILAAILVLNLRTKDSGCRERLGLGIVLMLAMAVAVPLFGAEGYKAWKLWGSVWPMLFIVVVASVVALGARFLGVSQRRWGAAVAGLVLVLLAVVGVRFSAREWGQSAYKFGVTPDLVALQTDPRLVFAPDGGVNVRGTATVDTLLLLLYAGSPTRVAITGDWFPALPPRFVSTLMPTALAAQAPGTTITVLNGSYVLTNTAVPKNP
jgi:hypothetical protein